jgi:probable biosynthetic protein (TIGR04098 family)
MSLRTAMMPDLSGQNGKCDETHIAIVGMSCRLPGGIETPEQLWQALGSGRNVISEFPRKRCDWPGATEYPGIDRGGFVEDVDAFDAAFFRISPAEARVTDPQQRIMLELAWSCLEDAGTLPAAMRGSNTAVFIGASNTDYSRLVGEAGLEIEAHHGVGSSLAVLANRISYFFDLSGPSIVLDTACSSSLVALHAAIRSLRSGECDAALAGGVNVICHPDLSIAYHKAGMLAPDGQCKVFDASANGYVRSEGAVMLLLEPLESALAGRDRIHAIIRGSAVNHGAWRSSRSTVQRAASSSAGGLTVPDPRKQTELLIAAWKDAAIDPHDLTYIEAHGTGTAVGDPIEIQGIRAAHEELGSAESPRPCGIGSIKSNLGHLESAAGLAGLLKVVLALKKRQIPATINFSQLNPKIRLNDTAFHIQDRFEDWNAGQPRLAGVSSFGSGGTNAHAVVQEYVAQQSSAPADGHHLFVLSATDEDRLRAYVHHVIDWLEREATESNFADAIYTWQAGRTVMKERLAVKVTDRFDLLEKLCEWSAGNASIPGVWSGSAEPQESPLVPAGETGTGQPIDQAILEKDIDRLAIQWASSGMAAWRRLHEADSARGERQIISLPTYPFTKERYWIDSGESRSRAADGRESTESVEAAEDVAPETLAEKTLEYLRRQVCIVANLPVHAVDPGAPLEQYGIDSILSMKLIIQLEQAFGSLPKTLLFEYQTIRDLAGYFTKHHSAPLLVLLAPPTAARAVSTTVEALRASPRLASIPKRGFARDGMASDPLAIRPTPQKLDDQSLYRRVTLTPSMCGHNSLLLAQVADWTWQTVSAACGTDLYHEKNASGMPTYLSFFYVRTIAGPAMQMHELTFGDALDVVTTAFHFGPESILTLHRVAPAGHDAGPPHPVDPVELYERRDERCLYIESLNRWVTRNRPGNEALIKSSPEGIVTSHLPVLPDRYSPRPVYDAARRAGTFHDVTSPDYELLVDEFSVDYTIDAARDLNGVELVFFASFAEMIDSSLLKLWKHLGRGVESFMARIVRDRRICYVANADVDSTLRLTLRCWRRRDDPGREIFNVVMKDAVRDRLVLVSTLDIESEISRHGRR